MNQSELKVFGVLRYADEHELMLWEVAKRAEFGIQKARTAVNGLAKQGLVSIRRWKNSGGQCGASVSLVNSRTHVRSKNAANTRFLQTRLTRPIRSPYGGFDAGIDSPQ